MTRFKRCLVLVPLISILLAACAPSAPPRTTTVASVDVGRFLGTWYEVASVKQFFSVGLVGTTATYSANPDGSIKVVNAGRYFSANGLPSTITGAAVPVDPTNAKLNVSFAGAPSRSGAGNYWIVDLDPQYRWAIVSDPTGTSCYLLSRSKTMSEADRAELLRRAKARGVDVSNVTVTKQP